MKLPEIKNKEQLEKLISETGFLPFFKNDIEGFSIEECCAPELWFSEDKDGPWEWKGPIARAGNCAYGKFFGKKAGFISLEHLPHFINYRRDGYDFDARCDDGLSNYKDELVFAAIEKAGEITSKELKAGCNFSNGGIKGFDTVITRLQMQTYVCIGDFPYETDKFGKPYGWGIAEYTTFEKMFGKDLVTSAYRFDPMESKRKTGEYLKGLLIGTNAELIDKFIG